MLQLYLGTVAVDAATTVGSHVVATNVVGAAVNDYCDVLGAGPAGATLVACITAVGSGNITLGYAASVAVTDATVTVWKPYKAGRYSLSGEVSSLTNQPSIAFAADRLKEAVAPVEGQPVLLLDLALVPAKPSANQDGDIFGGSIASVDVTQIAGNANATYDCQCVSWESIAARRGTGQPNDISGNPLNGTFSGMAAGGVFQWIANLLVSDISAVSVVTGPTIPDIKFDYTDIASAFDSICEASSDGTNTYIWRFDGRRNLFFEIQSTHSAPWNVANSDALVGCTYGRTLEKFANSATVTPQSSSGNTIDSTLVRTYNNVASINARAAVEGGTGYHETIVAQGSANASMSADTLAESVAKTYGEVPATVQYSAYRAGLRAGHLQTIVISDLGISGTFLIDSVSLSMSNGKPLWQIHAVDGALIGDWRTALADLASGRRFSSVSGGASNEFYTDAIVADHISPDLANGFNHQVYLVSGTPVTVDNPIFTGGTIATGQDFTLRVLQDSVGSRPDPVFDTDYSGTGGTAISTAALSVNTYYFRFDGTDFALIGFAAGSGGGGTATPPPDQPTSVTGAEVGSRTLQQPLAQTVLTIRATCTLAGGSTADRARVWLGIAGIWRDQGEFPFAPGVPHIDFPFYAPPAEEWWYVRVSLGNVGGYSDPATATTSAAFTVAAIAPPGTSLSGSTVTVASGAGGTFPYDVVRANGSHYWSIPSIEFDDTPALADPSSFFLRWTAEDFDAGGVSVRGEEAAGGEQISVAGTVKVLGPIMGEYGTAPNRTGNIASVKFRLYICSRVQQTGEAWLNSAASTLQKTVSVTVAVGGAVPVDLVNMSAADPATLDPSMVQMSDGLGVNTTDLSDMVLNGGFENGLTGWGGYLGGALGSGVSINTTSVFTYTGSKSCSLTPNATTHAEYVGEKKGHRCNPGDAFHAQAYVAKYETFLGQDVGQGVLIVYFLDSAGAGVGTPVYDLVNGPSFSGWHQLKLTTTAPAGASSVQAMVYIQGETSGNAWFVDSVSMRPLTTADTLADAAVLTAKLGSLAVDNTKLAALAVDAAKLATGAVTTPKFAALAVDAAALANSAVTSTKIANLAVGTAAIANLAVTSGQIANLAVGNAAIANLAVGTAQIANLAVTNAKISDLDVSKLNAGTISVAVSLTSPTITITSGTLTINLDATNKLKMTDSGLSQFATVTASTHRIESLSNSGWFGQLGLASLILQDNSGNRTSMGGNFIACTALSSSSPGAGTKQFWYDPSDGNRVKFAA